MRILYAEDTDELSRAVCAVLTHEGFDVTACADGLEASKALVEGVFDLAILDIMMPGKSGIEVLQDMRATGDVTPVLLLTAKTEVDDRVLGLEAGADDYLPKPFAMKELIARIRSLVRRNTDYGTGDLSYGDLKLYSDTYELSVRNSVRLSHAEFELLKTFILNPEKALGVEWLLGRVWGQDDTADSDTVVLYVRYLCTKLQAVGSALTVEEVENGYMLVKGDGA